MKVPLVYPKIPDSTGCMLKQCVAFEKLDGTNIHWVWEPKIGFVAMGTRRDRYSLFDEDDEEFDKNHPGLKQKDLYKAFSEIEVDLDELIDTSNPGAKEIIVFTEYLGSKSFAGQHDPKEKKKLFIIDVQVDGKLMPPDLFVKQFDPKWFPVPKVIYKGKYSGQLVEDIRKGKYSVKEGAVIKGMLDNQIYMVKVKTDAYMERLKAEFKDSWKNYWE